MAHSILGLFETANKGGKSGGGGLCCELLFIGNWIKATKHYLAGLVRSPAGGNCWSIPT